MKTLSVDLKLKTYIERNIPFTELKKLGFFEKGIKKTDYEKIAARVCQFFGFKSVYEYDLLDPRRPKQVFKQMETVDILELLTEKKWCN